MAAQKVRQPGTFEDAIAKIIATMGRHEAAAVVRKSAQLVYAWGDEDDERKPKLAEALALDAAFVAGGHGEAPILSAYVAQITAVSVPHEAMHVADRLMDVMHQIGDVCGEVRASLDPDGPGGAQVTAFEYGRVSGEVAEAIDALQKLQRDLDHMTGRVISMARA